MPFKNSPSFDYVPSKRLVQLGSPILYALSPPEEKTRTLTRKTLGVRDPNKTNKTILLVGETGAGKSTMVNSLVNFALGVQWDHDAWFEIVEERSGGRGGGLCESRTSDVVVYEIFGFEGRALPYSLTIIDTPGYEDARGTDRDHEVSRRLLEVFSSGVQEVDVVGLVLKGSENFLSDRLRYVFDSVMSLFGKDMEKNIVSLITHSDGMTPTNVLRVLQEGNIQSARDQKNLPVHFLFNNCQKEDRSEDNGTLKCLDQITMKGIRQLMDFLEERAPQNLKTTVDVLKTRTRLTACVQDLREKMEVMEPKLKEIRQTQESVSRHKAEMKKNSNFSFQSVETYKDKESISGPAGAVRCLVCEENCHYPCERVYKPGSCMVMRRARCTACPGRCSVTDHVKDKWRYVTRTRTVERIIPEVKVKFDRSQADFERASSRLRTLQREMEPHLRDKSLWINEAFGHVLKLEDIPLNTNSLSTHVHLDFLLETLRERGDAEKVRTLENIKSRGAEGARVGLMYMLGQRLQSMRPRDGYN